MQPKDSFLYISSFGSGRPLWSLAVEWWMYMSFGWLFLKKASTNKCSYYLILFGFLIVPLYNLFSGSKTEGLAAVWIMGCMITLLLDKGGVKNIHSAFLSLILFVLAIVTAVHFASGYNILTALLFTMCLYFFIDHTNNAKYKVPVMIENLIKKGAGYSFTLYLLHYSILQYLLILPKEYSPLSRFWVYFLVSNLISLLIASFTEMRYRKFSHYIKALLNKRQIPYSSNTNAV